MTRTNLARAGFTVFAFFLASRILGWVRVAVLVRLFGNSAEGLAQLDAYYAAFRIPDLIYQLVAAGAIASSMVPVLSDLLGKGESARAWRVASAVCNIVLLSMTAAAASCSSSRRSCRYW
ncbi:MAG: lipid II flippase MurJ [Chloroflexota bacterium]